MVALYMGPILSHLCSLQTRLSRSQRMPSGSSRRVRAGRLEDVVDLRLLAVWLVNLHLFTGPREIGQCLEGTPGQQKWTRGAGAVNASCLPESSKLVLVARFEQLLSC